MNTGEIFEQIALLRHPEDGCHWDRKQTLSSYAKPLISEAEELVEALENGDLQHVREEAGDLLWNLCFLIHLCEEEGAFRRDDVLRDVVAKMTRRHPHVYGDKKATTEAEALAHFKAAKAAEKKSGTIQPENNLNS